MAAGCGGEDNCCRSGGAVDPAEMTRNVRSLIRSAAATLRHIIVDVPSITPLLHIRRYVDTRIKSSFIKLTAENCFQVTSKPDLYPLVISYGSENGKIGDNYLMVQYFRNYIVRPTLGTTVPSRTVRDTSLRDRIPFQARCRPEARLIPSVPVSCANPRTTRIPIFHRRTRSLAWTTGRRVRA